MEANFFRHLAAEAGILLAGRRIEKIYAPADNVWTLRLDGKDAARYLLFRPAKIAGLLFFSAQKPANPFTAPARVMWLRKRLGGRRIIGCRADWPSLRLALELAPTTRENPGRCLILDLREGLRVCDEPDTDFGAEPEWPGPDEVMANKDIWREYPQISPPLRKRLASLDPDDARDLYLQVIRGDRPSRFHAPEEEEGPGMPLVWPSPGRNLSFDTALEAAEAWGARTLFPDLEDQAERPEFVRLKRQRKKIAKALERLDQEKARLDGLIALREQGEALKANLYTLTGYDGEQNRIPERITLEHPVLGPLEIELDPQISPAANMERLFRLADKGRRGYVHLARRRNELGKELARLDAGGAPAPGQAPRRHGGTEGADAPAPLPKRWQGLAVSLFTTEDGFAVARGKNKKANHEMLSRAASPFDYWFHAQDGPSSHVILKRDHPAQEVPERSLLQAAELCALKSSFKGDGRVEVMYALVKDIRKIKGLDHGSVAVDQVQGTLAVRPDPELEQKLARKA
ncbi:NFACT RNA binding domain-containing protein [Paucidesulfovibrio longus]|uniref:NFACT RNA binding domain-containing protein n=1 Tax=Paucidesulfovibrio longus TaxID=889 RepID=UPI0003B2EBB4|nr:NFACT RNA binding domain-containing protein [Paucidesulfovibrio longus]